MENAIAYHGIELPASMYLLTVFDPRPPHVPNDERQTNDKYKSIKKTHNELLAWRRSLRSLGTVALGESRYKTMHTDEAASPTGDFRRELSVIAFWPTKAVEPEK
jgi:hypothetical protein